MVKQTQKKYWKMRQQARLIVANVGIPLFLKAQDHKCPICDERLKVNDITIDHVQPLHVKNENYGNIFLCHHSCNQEKADRLPTDRELTILAQVNERLRYDPEISRYHCRQTLISRYYKMAMWYSELVDRGASSLEMEKVKKKMSVLEDQVGYWIEK